MTDRPVEADASISADTFQLVLSGTTKGILAVAGGPSAPVVSGAATGDTILRAVDQKIVLSANAASTAQMVMLPSGFVGLGTTNPQRLLHLVGPEGAIPSFPASAVGPRDVLVLENNHNTNISLIAAAAGYQHAIRFIKSGDAAASGSLSYMHGDDFMFFVTRGAERMRIDAAGRVGFGINAPISPLHQYTNTANNPVNAEIADTGGKDGLLTLNASAHGVAGSGGGILFGGYGHLQFFAAIKSLLTNGAGNTAGDLAISTRNSITDGALTERIRIESTGDVGIGTPDPQYKLHVNGSGRFEGALTGLSIQAQYQDVAEWVPATDMMSAGTVVVLDRTAPNTVTASKSAYDTAVAGVISAEPGVLLGVEGPNKVRVATTGRVKVRVDARSAPIAIGDLLVTSAVPGVAMRSEPMTLNGRTFHQPGTLIGKALEPLEKGTGEILVLLSLQ